MFYCTVFSYYCSKTSFICFSGFHRKKHNDIGKYIWSHVLQVSQVKHTLARQSSFSVFRKLFFHTVFSLRPEYLRSMSMQLRCCLNHAKTPTPKSACFAAQAFVLLSKMRVFASTAFLFLTIAKSVGGESFFVTSAHFHFIDDGFYFLRAMISSDTK